MKTKIGIWIFSAFALFNSAAQDAQLFSVHSDSFLEDTNPLRYSPVNAFDNDASTVFARSLPKQGDSAVLISVDFAAPTDIDGIKIKAGYFDSRYFAKNHRIQKIRIVVRPADSKKSKFSREFVLEDKMEAQDLLLGSRQNASGVDIIVNSVYEGSQWKDVVVSGVSFLRDGAILKNTFKHTPQNTPDSFSSSQQEHGFAYNEAGKPVIESWNYHKMGWREAHSTYNPEGLLIFRLHRLVDPEKLTDLSESFFYKNEETQPFRSILYNADGSLNGETMYTYSGSQLVKEVRTGENPSVKTWLYTGNLLTQEETSAINRLGNEYTEKTEYFFTASKATGERRTYTLSGKTSRTLYHYIYDGPSIRFKIPVLEDKGYSSYSEELFYKNGLLAETRSSDFTEWASR